LDILTHTLSGLAIGTTIAAFSQKGLGHKIRLMSIGALGGALPDIDAISLWSGFDVAIGAPLDLEASGKEIYFGKYWYSHHGFFHSITAGVLFAALTGLAVFFIKIKRNNHSSSYSLFNYFKRNALFFVAFVFAFNLHLFQDTPTPSSVWGGVRLLWPSVKYVGGTGHAWWWNNYDIFLIVLGVLLFNSVLLIIKIKTQGFKRWLSLMVLSGGILLSIIQITNRPASFYYSGHTSKYYHFEAKSKEIQEQILGKRVFIIMSNFDKKLPFYF
jgi:hypothetical protein